MSMLRMEYRGRRRSVESSTIIASKITKKKNVDAITLSSVNIIYYGFFK